MSKKSKRKKLKKKLRKMLQTQMAEAQKQDTGSSEISTKETVFPKKEKIEEKESKFPKTASLEPKKVNFTEKLNPHISYDIRKVLITIGISIIIVIGIVIIANYTNWLNILSQKIAGLINL